MHPPINLLRLADGRVRAVCRFCARQSVPALPDTSGEPDLWRRPAMHDPGAAKPYTPGANPANLINPAIHNVKNL